ncbi:MAG TPA: DUF5996 family protein [Gemmatimonadales bacterium]
MTDAWPALPLGSWRETCETLHMWTQIVGKTRLALAPMENHWWQVALYVTERGLTTSPIPSGDRTFAVDFDLLEHKLSVSTSDGAARTLPLGPRPVADFYQDYRSLLRSLDLQVKIWPVPVEVENSIRFTEDRTHASYDAESATRLWRVLVQADRVLKRFRGGFLGKASPVHFFWGGFDLAATRFSGRRAPLHPGGVPHVGDWVMHEAYSHEVSSLGFWFGRGPTPEPLFYAYAYPEPAGFRSYPVKPGAARYDEELREFVLPYEAVRTAANPDEAVLDFAQTTYAAAADRGGWDRAALERPTGGQAVGRSV